MVISPDYLKESLEEIERMHRLEVNLIGELVHTKLGGWSSYNTKEFSEIFDLATQYDDEKEAILSKNAKRLLKLQKK